MILIKNRRRDRILPAKCDSMDEQMIKVMIIFGIEDNITDLSADAGWTSFCPIYVWIVESWNLKEYETSQLW